MGVSCSGTGCVWGSQEGGVTVKARRQDVLCDPQSLSAEPASHPGSWAALWGWQEGRRAKLLYWVWWTGFSQQEGEGGWPWARAGERAAGLGIQGRCTGTLHPPPRFLGRSLTLIAQEKLIMPALASSQISKLDEIKWHHMCESFGNVRLGARCYCWNDQDEH